MPNEIETLILFILFYIYFPEVRKVYVNSYILYSTLSPSFFLICLKRDILGMSYFNIDQHLSYNRTIYSFYVLTKEHKSISAIENMSSF